MKRDDDDDSDSVLVSQDRGERVIMLLTLE
jgi:hypothetical protein